MYHAHFRLERPLFGEGIAADAAVFRTPRHDRLVAEFKLAFASPTSSIVLQGQAGVGKTTLTAAALRASTTRLAAAWVNGMATNAAELLELILVELGISTLRTTRIERLQLWRQFQGEMRATDSRLFIVAERTEDLPPEVLHALDQLTAPDAAGNPGANLVLLGHTGIHEHLAAPVLDSLRQRVRLRAELEPFTEAELQDFLRHQVACAAGHYDHLFAPGTVGALYRYSRGVARLAITLCESALEHAAAEGQKQLTSDLVAKTATSQLGLADTAPAARPAQARVEQTVAAEPRPIPAAMTAAVPVERAPEARVVAAPPPAPAAAAAAARVAPPPPAPTAPRTRDVEYDGSATDVADVAFADFPILTDAVETPPLATRSKPVAPATAKASAAPAVAPPVPVKAPGAPPVTTTASIAAAAAAPPAPAARATTRSEPAAAVSRPAEKPTAAPAPAATASSLVAPAGAPAKPSPSPAPPAAKASPAPAAASAPVASPPDPTADDALRQTQTMRAISVAKSIDDISEVDAETLFSDAQLDLVAAALASAAEWDDEEETAPAPPSAPAEPRTAKTMPPDDDLLGLFGLGDDAPLELIDDSVDPTDRARKTAAR